MTSTTALVGQLKEDLLKESNASDSERVLDILQRLDESRIDLQVLSETLVGTAVSRLKAHPDEEVSGKARALVKKWKKLAKEGGVGKASKGGGGLDRQSSSSSIGKGKAALGRQTSNTNIGKTAASVKKASAPTQKSAPVARAASNVSSTSAPSAAAGAQNVEEWKGLPPLRQNICKKLHGTFLLSKQSLSADVDSSTLDRLLVKRSGEVEQAIQDYSRNNRQAYTDKARSLCFNLKKNAQLCENVLLSSIKDEALVTMSSEQLATSEKAKQRAELVHSLQDSRRLDWEQANETKINEMCGIKGDLLKASLFTCGRCKSTKTTSTQKQTRSADEPMTVFVLCINCGNRWKC